MCPDHLGIPRRVAQITALTDLVRNLRCLENEEICLNSLRLGLLWLR